MGRFARLSAPGKAIRPHRMGDREPTTSPTIKRFCAFGWNLGFSGVHAVYCGLEVKTWIPSEPCKASGSRPAILPGKLRGSNGAGSVKLLSGSLGMGPNPGRTRLTMPGPAGARAKRRPTGAVAESPPP
jgi:hypothetical protein